MADEIRIVKQQEDQRLVFGWANISIKADGEEIVDLQGDITTIEDVEQAVYEYVLEFREAGEQHKKKGTGRLVESIVFTEEKLEKMGLDKKDVPLGWWVGFKIDDDEAWEKIKNQEYLMFSIEGQGTRKAVKE